MPDGRIHETKGKTAKLSVVPDELGLPESLVKRAADDPEALEKLCELYVPKIYSYVLKRVGRVHDAEDITSTVFEKVLLNLDTFDRSRASFSTWIYRITLNCVTDYYRSRGRKREASLEETSAAVADDPDVERLELYMAVVELLQRLPVKYQEALTLRYFGEMRIMEVARVLGISETAASKRVLRGLAELRRLASGGPLDEFL